MGGQDWIVALVALFALGGSKGSISTPASGQSSTSIVQQTPTGPITREVGSPLVAVNPAAQQSVWVSNTGNLMFGGRGYSSEDNRALDPSVWPLDVQARLPATNVIVSGSASLASGTAATQGLISVAPPMAYGSEMDRAMQNFYANYSIGIEQPALVDIYGRRSAAIAQYGRQPLIDYFTQLWAGGPGNPAFINYLKG